MSNCVLEKLGPSQFVCGKLGPGNIGRRQIRPRQIGPLEIVVQQIGPQTFLHGKLLVQGCQKLYYQVLNEQIQKCKFTNTLIHKYSIYPIQINTLGNIYQLNLYIGIGYILPTIGGYIYSPTLRPTN